VTEFVDSVVVGAGVVGLAVAAALARRGLEVVVLEATGGIGNGTSSRNSEVVHAGIYYPAGSLKARLCVEGRERLYRYMAERGVPHRRCGKLIVATEPEDLGRLEALRAKAAANGVDDLRPLGAAEALALEPELRCAGALLSPSTGILDSHAYMLALRGEAEDRGAMIAFNAPLERAAAEAGGFALRVGGAHPAALRCRLLVNAAGLDAQGVAARIDGLDPALVPPLHLARGHYFALAGRPPFSRLVYPLPEPGGLGVHVTLDLAGQVRFGPDVEWVDRVEYGVDPARAARFYPAIRRYWPGLPDGALRPGYAGIRPKTVPAGTADADFTLHGPAAHGLPGLVNLFGIESPGLTASPAIADAVAEMLGA